MKFYKILLLVLFTVFTFSVSAEDVTTKIDLVNYEGNLSSDTVIKIRGTLLDKCSDLKINDKKIIITTKSTSEITFSYGDIMSNNGSISLNCGDDILKNYYSFPIITKITGLSDSSSDKNITVSGENFGFEPLVVLEGGIFEYGIKQNTIITGTISDTLDNNNFYVTVNGLKSNLFKLDIKIPEITFVHSNDNFYKNSEITIFGNNLNYYKNSVIYLGEKEITNYDYDNKNGSIKINSNSKLGLQDLIIESNGFFSNTIALNIIGDLPYINKVSKKNIDLEINSEYQNTNIIALSGENLPGYIDDITVKSNGVNIPVISKNGDEIYLNDNFLKRGDNFFQIEVNGKVSNIVNLFEDIKLPIIQGYDFLPMIENFRVMKVYLYNFDQEIDKIYVNGNINIPKSCDAKSCEIQFSENILDGKISVGNSEDINPDFKEFDISFNNYPYIEHVYIKGDLKQGTKIEIIGTNFKDSTLNFVNLFAKDSKGNYDVKVTANKIEGTLFFGYDIDIESKVTCVKYGQTSTIKFTGNNIESQKVYGSPIITNLESLSSDGLFKVGTIVEISGKGFNLGDQIVFGSVRTSIDIIDSSNGKFIIPDGVSDGSLDIYIENKSFLKSNSYNLIVVPDYFEENILFNSDKITKNIFNVGEIATNDIFKLNITNKIKDLYVKNISFKIEENNSNIELGTFDLKIGGKLIGTSLVNEDGVITFTDQFLLEKNFKDSIVTISKKSLYTTKGTYKINFLADGLEMINKDKVSYTNFDFGDIYPNRIKLVDKSVSSCIDTRLDSMNCNKFISSGILLEKTPAVINKPITNKTEEIVNKTIVNNNVTTVKLKGIVQHDFKSKSYKNLNKALNSYMIKLSKKSKYKDNILEIEDKVNDIIKDLFLYEKYKDNKMKRTVMKKKLLKDAKLFKEMLK